MTLATDQPSTDRAPPPPSSRPPSPDLAQPSVGPAAVNQNPSRLRRLLVIGDICALLVIWLPAEAIRARDAGGLLVGVGFALAQAGMGIALLGAQRLYRARTASVPRAELRGLTRVAVATAISGWLFARWWWSSSRLLPEVAAAGSCLLCLYSWRGAYASWLRSHRQHGRYARHVVVVGNRSETKAVVALLMNHPGLGYIPTAIVCDCPTEIEAITAIPAPDPCSKLQCIVEQEKATGVILCASVMSSGGVNDTIECLHTAGVHVQLFSGLMGIDPRRIRSVPVAHEPLYYLEPRSRLRYQEALKRVIDFVGASVMLVVTSPVLLLAAVMIKLEDRGPILFRQERLGRNGRPFMIIKLRTMMSNAEAMATELADRNIRTGGPLFKVRDDPRVTHVGRLLRESCLDELPQLVNVLRGQMSLVGPRPALASETEQFDEVLRRRLSVRPGVTGLWQVEAQDNPSFFAYRHLDLFYTQNWSPIMDLAIVAATVQLVMSRLIGTLVRMVRQPSAQRAESSGWEHS